MYPPNTASEIAPLVASGQLDLSLIEIHRYPLSDVNEAVEHAAKTGPLETVVICPTEL